MESLGRNEETFSYTCIINMVSIVKEIKILDDKVTIKTYTFAQLLGPLLLTRFNFNPSMYK